MIKMLTIPVFLLLLFCGALVYIFTDVPQTLGIVKDNTAGFNAVYVMRIDQVDAEFDHLNSSYHASDTYQLSKEERLESLGKLGKALVSRGYVTDLGTYKIQITGLRRGEQKLVYAHAWCHDIDTGDIDPRKRLVTRIVDDGYRCFLDLTLDASGAVTIKPHAY